MRKFRLWENGEDMGTASERVAFMWLEEAKRQWRPGERQPYIEPVFDDAPEFLPQPSNKPA